MEATSQSSKTCVDEAENYIHRELRQLRQGHSKHESMHCLATAVRGAGYRRPLPLSGYTGAYVPAGLGS